MDYPHAVGKLTDKFDDGFVVGYSEVSRGESVDPDLPHYFPEFQRGYAAGRQAWALMHASESVAWLQAVDVSGTVRPATVERVACAGRPDCRCFD